MKGRLHQYGWPGLAFLLALVPDRLLACAACFGRSDSKLAEGMNMGILTLLAVVLFVLGGFAAFFVYLARRASGTSARSATPSSQSAIESNLP